LFWYSIFAKISELFSRLRTFENSEFSKNNKKMASNSNFYFSEKNVLTRIFNRIVGYEFGMQGLSLLEAFTRTDPETSKRQSVHQCLFALLVSA